MADNLDIFDLCIIGSGSGVSLIDDDLNDWKIAIIDNGTGITQAFGGTCLNAGCIPTKMFAIPARYASIAQRASEVDVKVTFDSIDYKSLNRRIFTRTDAISESGLEGLRKRTNVEVFIGAASFIDDHHIKVGNRVIEARRIVIAAGSRPRILDVDSLHDPDLAPFIHTSESIMRMPQLPQKMVFCGGGVEAIEFASIYAALGVKVSIIARSDRLIRQHDSSIAQRITDLIAQKVMLRLNQMIIGAEAADEGGVVLIARDAEGMEYSYESDCVLIASGRIPNGDQLHLDRAHVEMDDNGFIVVDDHMRTTQTHIWALGDICSPPMLKHLANAQARTVKANLLAEKEGGSLVTMDDSALPFGIFADPEIAGVGASEDELKRSGQAYIAHEQRYDSVAYGWAMGDHDELFVKILANPTDEKILGAHIIGDNATILIQPLVMAMRFDLDLEGFARGQFWIHPALSEIIENAALGALEKIRSHKN